MKRLFALVSALLLLLSGCTAKPLERTFFSMNTVMQFQIWGRDSEIGYGRIITKLQELESSWSATSADSVLWQLNNGNSLFQIFKPAARKSAAICCLSASVYRFMGKAA